MTFFEERLRDQCVVLMHIDRYDSRWSGCGWTDRGRGMESWNGENMDLKTFDLK